MQIKRKVFGRKRVYTLLIPKCVYCGVPNKQHIRCKLCGILLHREVYLCKEENCSQPHTLSKDLKICNSCKNVSQCVNEYHFYSPKK